jgi:hypothetical protein
MAVETFDALVAERGDSGKIWASVLKEAIKRRKPRISMRPAYGFRSLWQPAGRSPGARPAGVSGATKNRAPTFFATAVRTAQRLAQARASPQPRPRAPRGRRNARPRATSSRNPPQPRQPPLALTSLQQKSPSAATGEIGLSEEIAASAARRGRRRDATPADIAAAAMNDDADAAADATGSPVAHEPDAGAQPEAPTTQSEPRRRSRGGRKSAGRAATPDDASVNADPLAPSQTFAAEPQAATAESATAAEPLGKPVARPRRPRKAPSRPENS